MQLSQRLNVGMELVFLAGAAFELASAASAALGERLALIPDVDLTPELVRPANTRPPLDGARLATLLGLPTPDSRPAPLVEAATPTIKVPSLRAQLQSTTVGWPVRFSWAIIRDLEANQTLVCLLGDPLFDGTLVEIAEDHVLVARAGGLERLDLGGSAVAQASPRNEVPVTTASLAREGNRISLSEAERAQLVKDPMAFAADVRARPQYEGGAMKGIQLGWMRPGSIFTQAGLQPGDVIQRVNGLTLDSADGLLGVLQQARTQPRVEIELSRGGEATSIVVEVHP
jgi:general secretion pathway protein C